MIYADVDFYQNKYLLGRTEVIPLAEFEFWARKASAYIDTSTFGRIELAIPDEVRFAACELAEAYWTDAQASSLDAKRSESVGAYSVSYADQTKKQDELNANLRAILVRWLANTGLLYRGI